MFGAIRKEGYARSFVAVLFAFALLLRVAIPTGFMPAATAHGITVRVCDGMGNSKAVVVDVERRDDGRHQPEHGKPAPPCAFAGLSAALLAGGQVPQVAPPALVPGRFALPPPTRFGLSQTDFLTPPLRGPPGLA